MIKKAQISNFIAPFFGATPTASDPFAWVQELINPESIAKNGIFFAGLLQNLRFRYNPVAFYHVEEIDKSRGYEAIDPNTGTPLIDPMTGEPMVKDDKPYVFQHSQGHLEKLDYNALQDKLNRIPTSGPHGATTDSQFSELKPSGDMPLFVKKNINISENSPEYKAMFDKLYPGVSRPAPTANSNKFVRVAQTAEVQNSSNNQKAQEIKKLMPKWDINTMIKDLDTLSQSGKANNLTNEQISLQIQNKLKQYQDSMKPLRDYLEKNGFGQKTK